MRLTLPDALGLIIGFSLGGLGLALYLPTPGDPAAKPAGPEPKPAVVHPAGAKPPNPPRAVTANVQLPRMPEVAAAHPRGMAPPSPPPAPLSPPRVTTPEVPQDPSTRSVSTMPNVIHPTERSKNVGLSGTGFFIANDGLLLTAAHVVDDCKTTQITSRYVAAAPARILATDTKNDLALLRAPTVRPPGLMAFAAPPAPGTHLTVYGYPSGSDTLVPTEALGTLRNDRAPGQQVLPSGQIAPAANRPPDPREFLWIDAQAVRQGFSGGPIVGPRGDVVGVLKGIVVNRETNGVGGTQVPTGMAIGPGTRPIVAFVQQEIPSFDIDAATRLIGTDTSENARKAVVHVYCWR